MLQSQSELIQRLTQQVRSLEKDHEESMEDNRILREEMAQITVALNNSQVSGTSRNTCSLPPSVCPSVPLLLFIILEGIEVECRSEGWGSKISVLADPKREIENLNNTLVSFRI